MMTTHRKKSDELLTAVLRAGDPAADGCAPTSAEIARWRAALPRKATRRDFTGRVLALATVAPLVLLLAAVVSIWRPRPLAPTPQSAAPTERAVRTIFMTAPGGTRIIWSINPGLEESTLRGRSHEKGDKS